MKKFRIYAVSLIAFSQLDPRAPRGGIWVEHLPGLIPAQSIEDAAEAAKQTAFERWPIDRHFYAHRATIMSADKNFYAKFVDALIADVVDTEHDIEQRDFEFDLPPGEADPLEAELIYQK